MPGGVVKLLTRQDVASLSVVYGKQNVLSWRLYDTEVLPKAGGLTQLAFFGQSKGQSGVGLPNTNLDQPNQLISGQSFVVTSIVAKLLPKGNATTDVGDQGLILATKAQFTFEINNVQYAMGSLLSLVGGGLSGFGDGAGGAVAIAPYAQARAMDCAIIDPAFVIPPTTGFSLTLNFDAAQKSPVTTNDVNVVIELKGKLIRLASA